MLLSQWVFFYMIQNVSEHTGTDQFSEPIIAIFAKNRSHKTRPLKIDPYLHSKTVPDNIKKYPFRQEHYLDGYFFILSEMFQNIPSTIDFHSQFLQKSPLLALKIDR